MRPFTCVVSAVLILAGAFPAFAQEQKFGLVLAYPTSIGVQWTLERSHRAAHRRRRALGSLSQASIGLVPAGVPTNTRVLAMRSGVGAIIHF
jgi:hypothetical protein